MAHNSTVVVCRLFEYPAASYIAPIRVVLIAGFGPDIKGHFRAGAFRGIALPACENSLRTYLRAEVTVKGDRKGDAP